MFERFFTLRGTKQAARTAGYRFAFHPFNIGMTDRALRGERYLAGIFWALLNNHPNHLWNNITGTAHDHRIVNAQAQALNFIGIVQGGITDHHPGHQHRFQARYRRDRPGTANLKLHIFDLGDLFLGRELEGSGPARCACHKAQAFLRLQGVNFDHYAINIKSEVHTVLLNLAIKRQYLITAGTELHSIADRQPPGFKLQQTL